MYDKNRGAILNGRNEKENKDRSLVFTKETLGVVLVLFSTLSLICLITRETLFSVIGQAVNAFFFGCFGFFAYAVVIYLIGLGVLLISGKKLNVSLKRKLLITAGFFVLALILQIATADCNGYEFGEYISLCYAMGENGINSTSAGGVVMGIFAFVICSILTSVGSYVILGLAIAGVSFFLIKDFIDFNENPEKAKKFRSSFVEEDELDVQIAGEKEYPVDGVDFAVSSGKQKLFVNNPNEFLVKNRKEIQKEQSNPNGIKIAFSKGGLGVVSSVNDSIKQSPKVEDDFKKKIDYIKTPSVIDMEKYSSSYGGSSQYNNLSQGQTSVSGYVSPSRAQAQDFSTNNIPFVEHNNGNYNQQTAEERARLFGDRYIDAVQENSEDIILEQAEEQEYVVNNDLTHEEHFNVQEQEEVQKVEQEIPFIEESEEISIERTSRASRFNFDEIIEEKKDEITTEDDYQPILDIDVEEQVEQPTEEEQPTQSNITSNARLRSLFLDEEKEEPKANTIGFTSRVSADNNQSSRSILFSENKEQEIQKEQKPKEQAPINRKYYRPPFDLLESYAQPINAQEENHQERMEIIQRTLEEFHINAVPENFVQGPSITRYEIMMPAGISVRNVLKYDDDLKMRLSAKNGVRIEAPIPGKNLVGIEVANNVKVTVGLKEVMEGLADKKVKDGALMFALGKDIVGNSISDDLTKGPHYLVAGATGSGKSVCLHVMIVSLLMRYSPEELKLVLVDPKSVEFRKYEHLPHLLVDEIITEPKRALSLLQWAYDETNRRNDLFTSCGGHISNIDDYNSMVANETTAKLPRIVFVIDELADLMEACKKDLEARIRMIAAKSRSAGIHLVLATQRPSVDVITGTIKANLPSRIALKVMNFADSQTILGGAGAEKLLGNGDMLYKNSSMADYARYQGAYISGREISNIVEYIKENNKAYFDQDIVDFIDKETRPKVEEGSSSNGDDSEKMNSEFLNALWFAVNSGTVSISSLQRRFSIGYAKAGGFVDKMEQKGFISGFEGSKARKVLLSKEEYISRFGPKDDLD